MKQGGMAMVEALVASAVLGLGLLGATRLTTHALDAALQTRQEVRAQALAADTLDCAIFRALPCPASESIRHQGTTYTVQLQYTPRDADLTEVQVRVTWATGAGSRAREHSLSPSTRISAMPDWVGLSLP